VARDGRTLHTPSLQYDPATGFTAILLHKVHAMRTSILTIALTLPSLLIQAPRASAQAPDVASAMHWREIGPTRAGRARAVAGAPGHPDVLYVGFDNGGLWRSSDYGSNWEPLFDREATGSIGAIAVAPSNPNVIYVGTGAGIIRPDLATGNGMYKSTDGGRTWTHLGLSETQMIAQVEVDPANPDRVFVAALGHPYGPNPERGIYRSTDGGRTFEKVLYKDEYTSANDVRIDPSNPNVVYAALWQQQEAFWEGGEFGGGSGGVFKSTDGGTTWTQLTGGLPPVLEANLAIAPSNPGIVYAMVAAVGQNGGSGPIGFYKSSDGGAHWTLRTRTPGAPDVGRPTGAPVVAPPAGSGPVTSATAPGDTTATADPRPLARIGGGDLAPIAVDPKDTDVVYSTTVVMWRTDDAGASWTAVRGAPGGDDYQKMWISPLDPNLLLVVSDQGAVVSTNRGASWSNWYTQPTGAMYHVTADNAFPYRLCGGQQDSGSGCVPSRSDDGEITFHDWHPINASEYGIVAPDPKDPDVVYGGSRTNVSRYDRRTGQTTQVGPDATARGDQYGRNVRTMPIVFSPVRPDVLYYTSNVVWKSADHGHSWTRISPDLARQTWDVPASAGKYASSVTPGPRGAITALAPSPRSDKVIWAGTDDGVIQVTMDGGAAWTNVTPPEIKPWTRIFNIDAGHFDAKTAYAAANTLRIDDANPHFWRTHDGGRTWTEIDGGIAPGAVANSIREDPRQPGLLYGATDTQVWVSFDDGNHWQSLRLDMPAISVRDIAVKDDSGCLCSDLVAGTHGRGFWILDDVTPLRQQAAVLGAQETGQAYLVKPETAVRVRSGTNDPTPWPPEVPAGENPPPGAILDYFLPAGAAGPVTLELVDGAGKIVRTYSSADPTLAPDPALDPVAYDRICRRQWSATDCGLPLYWPGPRQRLSAKAGMHRFAWDMRYQPVSPVSPADEGDVDAMGAVPHRSLHSVNAPWAAPGHYTVRLTVDGKAYTQPLVLRLDPRVKTPAPALQQLAALTRQMYDQAVAAHAAYGEARALAVALDTIQGQDAATFKAQVESLAPASRPRGRGFFFRRGAAGPPTLESAGNGALGAAMAMQSAEVAPTAAEVAACDRARTQAGEVLARWARLKTTGLAAFSAKRRAAGLAPIALP